MFRRDLIPLLLDRWMSLSEIAREVHETPKDVIDALTHIAKSAKRGDYDLLIEPAECRKCGFEFGTEKISRPGKCPSCKGTWIWEPKFSVAAKGS